MPGTGLNPQGLGANESFGSINTERIVDPVDGGDWETLKLLGWESGDVVPISSFGTTSSRLVSTSSSTYTESSNGHQFSVPSYLIGSGMSQVQVSLVCRIFPGTGETGYARLRGQSSEPFAELSSDGTDSAQRAESGYVSVPLSDITTSVDPRVEVVIKTEPGSNSTTFSSFSTHLGVLIP